MNYFLKNTFVWGIKNKKTFYALLIKSSTFYCPFLLTYCIYVQLACIYITSVKTAIYIRLSSIFRCYGQPYIQISDFIYLHFNPLRAKPIKMVKNTQIIRRLIANELFEYV